MFPKKHVLWNKEAEWNALVGLSVPFLMISVLLFLAWLTSAEPYKVGEITHPSTLGAAELSARRATERLVSGTEASDTSKRLAINSKSFPSVSAVKPGAFSKPPENPFEQFEKEIARKESVTRWTLKPLHKTPIAGNKEENETVE